jgi:hypothetical protein
VLFRKNHAPRASASVRRALMLLLMACLTHTFFTSLAAYAATPPAPTLREKDIARGESILLKLHRLEQLTKESATSEKHRKLIAKMYPGLFVEVADLRESDLKTDLTTAVFLYDEVLQSQIDSVRTAPDCQSEPREIYARLCEENKDATLPDFLMAKARLHTHWAEAVINYHRGRGDVVTMATLQLIREERDQDLQLARQAVEALQILEKNLCSYSTRGEYEEQRSLARVPFEQLAQGVAETLGSIDKILLALPRSPLFYPLYHARNAYMNGLFWWQKSHRRSKLVVNIKAFNVPDEMNSSRFDALETGYTIVSNWRKAIRHTREAANLIEGFKTS